MCFLGYGYCSILVKCVCCHGNSKCVYFCLVVSQHSGNWNKWLVDLRKVLSILHWRCQKLSGHKLKKQSWMIQMWRDKEVWNGTSFVLSPGGHVSLPWWEVHNNNQIRFGPVCNQFSCLVWWRLLLVTIMVDYLITQWLVIINNYSDFGVKDFWKIQ